ncbi:MAG TPA: hypothetical protein VHW00_18355 [Thermoanaerobaculia bacterium]|nr:hypothetical protein [Thermoanaerobaculia bacterium]
MKRSEPLIKVSTPGVRQPVFRAGEMGYTRPSHDDPRARLVLEARARA